MDEDKFLGPCKVCEEAGRKRENGEPNRLRIIDLKGGKRMYGCEGWNRDDPESPDSCRVSGPLPGRFFELWRLEERCSVCGERPRLTVKKRGPGRPWKLCLNDDCPTMVEMREKRAEREAQKEAREAAKAAGEGGGENGAAAGRGRRRAGEAEARRRAERGRRSRRRRRRGRSARAPAPETPVFITLEGIDRSGKTTQAAMLHDALGPDALLAPRAGRHGARRADPRAAQGSRDRDRPRRRADVVRRRPLPARVGGDRRGQGRGPRHRLRSLHRLDRRLPGRRDRALLRRRARARGPLGARHRPRADRADERARRSASACRT